MSTLTLYQCPETYRKLFRRKLEQEVQFLLEVLQPRRGPVLDLGAGTGDHAAVLQERGLEVLALDLVPEMVRTCRDKGVPAVRCDIRYLPLRSGAAECAYSLFSAVRHLTDTDDLIQHLLEVNRVLRTGGRYLIDVENPRGYFADPVTPPEEVTGEVEAEFEFVDVDYVTQVEYWKLRIRYPDGRVEEHELRLRVILPQELRTYLMFTGFVVEALYGDYSTEVPLSRDQRCWRLIAVGRKVYDLTGLSWAGSHH